MLLESLSPHCSVWGGRVQHNFPARADFVWIGHIVVSSCRPLGINNLCRFSFLLIDVSLHRGETGAGAGEKGGKLVKVTFPFLFLGSLIYGTWSLTSYTPVFWFSW